MGNSLEKDDVQCIGDKDTLYAIHGYVDVEKALKSLRFIANTKEIDIDELNKAAEEGILYLNDKGLPIAGDISIIEGISSYKVLPTCYTNKYSGKQLCVSFMKGPESWEGVFTGTIDKLIERVQANYSEHYGKLTKKEKAETQKYSGDFIIQGYGLEEVLKFNDDRLKSMQVEIRNEISIDEDTLKKLREMASENGEYTEETVEIEKPIVDEKKTERKVIPLVEKEVTEEEGNNEDGSIYDEIYNRLLIKENWKASSKYRLRFYVKSILEKISYEQKKTPGLVGNGYILSNSKEKCVFNTGLYDIYGNDIYLIDLDNDVDDFFKKRIAIVTSKASLMTHGFVREDVMTMPKPVRFYSDKSKLVFNGSIGEVDLEDNFRLNHIIQERRGRFPERYQDTPCDILAEKVKSAVIRAVKISERDYRYILPMYNIKMNKIQWMMPLNLDSSMDDAPELVVVVGENNGFYCVYTILNTDDAYDNARLLCRPESTWLTLNK